jgi:hypothetical protein
MSVKDVEARIIVIQERVVKLTLRAEWRRCLRYYREIHQLVRLRWKMKERPVSELPLFARSAKLKVRK